AGRAVATNGPLLSLTVNGKEPGDVLNLDKPATVKLEATAAGRQDFQSLQMVHNGKVVKTQPAERQKQGYSARLAHETRIDEPGWLDVRIDSTTKNEMGHTLFAHGSPVYINLAGKRAFNLETARTLLKELEESRATIRAKGKFSSPQATDQLLAVYEEATRE